MSVTGNYEPMNQLHLNHENHHQNHALYMKRLLDEMANVKIKRWLEAMILSEVELPEQQLRAHAFPTCLSNSTVQPEVDCPNVLYKRYIKLFFCTVYGIKWKSLLC